MSQWAAAGGVGEGGGGGGEREVVRKQRGFAVARIRRVQAAIFTLVTLEEIREGRPVQPSNEIHISSGFRAERKYDKTLPRARVSNIKMFIPE